jgi:sulfoxide reductase catalytic subunit YedY
MKYQGRWDNYLRIPSSQITPENQYISRRRLLKSAAWMSAALLASCQAAPTTQIRNDVDELGNPFTSYQAITSFVNYLEFSPAKTEAARLALTLKMDNWQVEITGLVRHPRVYVVEDLLRRYSQEDRTYRLRCVEGWSMVVPWTGFSLAALLKDVEPLADARYVRFSSVYAPDQMPYQASHTHSRLQYVEGLRLDEAMHPLCLLASGVYGKSLPPPNGGPLRLVVPWKYGFKSIKSLVRIELMSGFPQTFWNTQKPEEYGFYANVNPNLPHRFWSQEKETRIIDTLPLSTQVGLTDTVNTLPFNGYPQVEELYQGMSAGDQY